MKKSTVIKTGFVVFAIAVISHIASHNTYAQSRGNVITLRTQVKNANSAALTRLRQAETAWRDRLSELGSKARLQKMARELASFDEKLSRGQSWITPPRSPQDRMSLMFTRHVLNQAELTRSMQTAFTEFQQKLLTESAALYVKAGLNKEAARSVIDAYRISTSGWDGAFRPLLRKADTLATNDFLRFAAVTAGSTIATDTIMDAGTDSGLFKAKKGSFEHFLGSFVLGALIDAAADEITDPTEDFAKKLAPEFRKATEEILNGKSGFLRQLRLLTELHVASRSRHFRLTQKGGE